MQGGDRGAVLGWLAAVLMGRRAAWPFVGGGAVDVVLATAAAEGVAALLQQRLRETAAPVPEALHAGLDALVRVRVAQSLYQQSQARAILARLHAAGLPTLVLKGSALAHWAYAAPHLRECGDIDLLVPDAGAARRAVALVAALGYVPVVAASAGDLVDFETCCVRGGEGPRLEVDIHWHLSNAPLFAFRFGWDELWAGSVPLPGLAPDARGLAPVPALLHACMHRVQTLALGGSERLKWLYDPVAVARGFAEADWRAVQEQAIARGLAGVCRDTLQAAEARFGAFVPAGVIDALAVAERREPLRVGQLHRWWHFQRMDWQAFPTRRMRWRWLRQRVFPNAAYLRERHGAGSVPALLWRRMAAGLRRALPRR